MEHLFQSYPKIPENWDNLQLTEQDYRLLKKTEWVVTEKIHGANFCILANEEETHFAKRKEILPEEENFFGYHQLRETLTEKAEQIYTEVSQAHPDTVAVAIYGELFGGAYPHPKVASKTDVQAIQTGVYYSPEIHFWVFDLLRITDTLAYYVGFDALADYCQKVQLPFVPALFRGTYQEVQNYPIKFESTIAGLLDLPILEDNWAEGVVIKPAEPILLDTNKGWIRPVIKKKIELFSEDNRYHQAQKWAGEAGASNLLGEVLTAVHQLVNENRLQAVRSKIGQVDFQDVAQQATIKSALEADVWESFWEKLSPSYFKLTPEEQQQVNEAVTLAVEILVKQHVG
ncbi:MAG TPA: RNA ligase [Microscillaceae bacterium]|nr:RNA ligase [Microscillaceae bacterium]